MRFIQAETGAGHPSRYPADHGARISPTRRVGGEVVEAKDYICEASIAVWDEKPRDGNSICDDFEPQASPIRRVSRPPQPFHRAECRKFEKSGEAAY